MKLADLAREKMERAKAMGRITKEFGKLAKMTLENPGDPDERERWKEQLRDQLKVIQDIKDQFPADSLPARQFNNDLRDLRKATGLDDD